MSAAELHSAGAIVRHRSPFSELEVPLAEQPITRELIETWVKPLYMLDIGDVAAFDAVIAPIAHRIDERLVFELLSHFDWRPRLVAAHLAAVRNLRGSLDVMGRLLLRSDVCDAGRGYCVALAAFNTPQAREYLYRYLDYYLKHPELWFDQADVLAAVICLDEANGTSERRRFEDAWKFFVANKPNWDLDRSTKSFARRLRAVSELATRWAARDETQ
jgi:hypothetical protein